MCKRRSSNSTIFFAIACFLSLSLLQFESCHGFNSIKPVRNSNKLTKLKPPMPFAPVSSLYMSSIPEKAEEKKEFRFPPPPEDFIVLGGDLVALFTYALLDHGVTALMVADAQDLYSAPDALSIPVWSDVMSNNFGPALLTAITAQQQLAEIGDAALIAENEVMLSPYHYAPCLETFGCSAVLLGTCWLIAGYFNHAFEYKNTISCDTNHALIVAGRTWIFTAMMLVGIAVWSDTAFCGCLDNARGLTKADTDFIFDSFSVLVTWRFVASTLLGGLM